MDQQNWPHDNAPEPLDDRENQSPVEFFNVQPRHVPNPAAPNLDEDFADDPVEHPRQFRAFQLKQRKRRLTRQVAVSILMLLVLAAGGFAISRLVAGKRTAASEETTPTTVIQVTTATTLPPVQILSIQEGQRYNIRSTPELSGAALKTAVGGDQFTVQEIVTGEMTQLGDQWYEVELDGQTAYIIVDATGQELSTN